VKHSRLKKIDLLRIFLRSFLIQASWNYKGMLNLGFLFTIMPGLRRLYPDKKDRQAAVVRHFEFFNTHPYLASYAVGATLSAEEEAAERRDKKGFDDVLRLKSSLCGPLGALGDNLFWNRWRPMCAVIGLLGSYLWGIWGVVVFLILYNVPHLSVRYWGLHSSYRDRVSFVNELSGNVYRTVPAFGERMGAFFMGCLTIVLVGYNGSFDLQTRAAFLGALMISFLLLRKFRRFRVTQAAVVIIFTAITLSGVSSWLK